MSEWYYAKDGAQLGPVNATEIKTLLANGTLNANTTMVWKSGMADWIPAVQAPELASAPAVANDPYAAPVSGFGIETSVDASIALSEIEPGSEPIDAMACFKRGLDLTVRHLGLVLLAVVVWIGILIGISLVTTAVETVAKLAIAGTETQSAVAIVAISVVSFIISQLVSLFLTLGFTRFTLNVVSGREATLGLLFGEGGKVVKALLATIVFYIPILLIVAIVSGISAALLPVTDWWIFIPTGLVGLLALVAYSARFGFFITAIVDRNCGIIESLRYSSQITQRNRLGIVFLYILGIIAALVGLIAMCIGVLFAIPVAMIAMTVAYRWMQYGNRAAMDHPGTATPMLTPVG